MHLLGLIGYPLSHSFSEKYFAEKFRQEKITGYVYKNFPLESIGRFPQIASQPGLLGLNVTIPYKEQVIPYLDEIDETARQIGAVNTIKVTERDGKRHLKGFNTDAYGFYHSILPHLEQKHKKALILGSGGASKAVKFVLDQQKIEYRIVSRLPSAGQLGYGDLCLAVMRDFLVIINTTPLGTYPDTASFPDIPYDLLSTDHLLYDLVYNPPETKFLKMGKQKGAKTVNGYDMLKLQAEKSWDIWTNR